VSAPRRGLDAPASGAGRTLPALLARLVALALVAASCASAGGFRERNRENLDRLEVGMTREAVMNVMGTETVRATGTEGVGAGVREDSLSVSRIEIPIGDSPVLQNPHRTATFEAGGHAWEVLYYYTNLVRDDGFVTDDELTPVVLRDGLLTGWGWDFWAAQVSAYAIPAEIPTFGPPGAEPGPGG